MSAETGPVIMRVTAVFDYELEPDLERRRRSYGTIDPAECAKADASNDPMGFLTFIADEELKSFTIEAVTGDALEKETA